MIKNQKKKKKYGNQVIFLHKSQTNRWFGNEIHSLLSRANARGSADIITVCDACRYFVGQAYLLTSKSRSRREYLILTDNITVLDHFFTSSKKSNFIGRL